MSAKVHSLASLVTALTPIQGHTQDALVVSIAKCFYVFAATYNCVKRSLTETPTSKPLYTSAEKSACKGAAAIPFKSASSKPDSKLLIMRYADIDTSTLSKKDTGLKER